MIRDGSLIGDVVEVGDHWNYRVILTIVVDDTRRPISGLYTGWRGPERDKSAALKALLSEYDATYKNGKKPKVEQF